MSQMSLGDRAQSKSVVGNEDNHRQYVSNNAYTIADPAPDYVDRYVVLNSQRGPTTYQ